MLPATLSVWKSLKFIVWERVKDTFATCEPLAGRVKITLHKVSSLMFQSLNPLCLAYLSRTKVTLNLL